MKKFMSFGFTDQIVSGLHRMDITEPTQIQEQTIPLALAGKDILGSAQTGTGKTFAFGLPILQKLMTDDSDSVALIVTPTRELAAQVHKSLTGLLGRKSGIESSLLIGGDSMPKQLRQLSRKPQLIVGTPGRINDHLDRNSLKLTKAKYLVLDETDRMLDMGFSVQIEEIAKRMPEERQTLLFSATLPKGIVHLTQKYLNNPERIAVGEVSNPAENVTQEVMFVKDSDKMNELLCQLESRTGTAVLFVKTKAKTELIAKQLNEHGYKASAMHGDLPHRKRERVLKDYRAKKFRILVATDIAARGLDIPHIELVISYDLPQLAEDYIHRIGRTARAGASGESISFVAPADRVKFRNIQRLLFPDATAKELDERFPMPKAKSKNSRKKMADKPQQGKKRLTSKGTRGAERFEGRSSRSEGGNKRFGGSESRGSRSNSNDSWKKRSEDGSRSESRGSRSEGGNKRFGSSEGRGSRSEGGNKRFGSSEGRGSRSEGGNKRFGNSEGRGSRSEGAKSASKTSWSTRSSAGSAKRVEKSGGEGRFNKQGSSFKHSARSGRPSRSRQAYA